MRLRLAVLILLLWCVPVLGQGNGPTGTIPQSTYTTLPTSNTGIAANTPGIPTTNGTVFYVSNYGLPTSPATVAVCDATYNGTTTVTTPTTDPPFTVGATYPVVWGFSNVECGGNPQSGVSMTQMVPTSATATAAGAHTLTLSSAALGSCTPAGQGLCSLVAGPSAASAVSAAYAAAVTSGAAATLVLPNGPFIVDSNVTGSTMPCTNTGGGNDTPCFLTVRGDGPSSWMLVGPAVTFATPMFYPTNATTNGVIFVTYKDFTASSLSPEIAGQNGQSIFQLQFGWEMQHVILNSLFPQTGINLSCVNINGVQNSITMFHDNQLLNCGGIMLNVNGVDVNIFNNWVQGSNNCITTANTSRIKSWGNRFTICGTNSAWRITTGTAEWDSQNDVFNAAGTTLPAINLSGGAGTVLKLHNAIITCSQTSGPAINLAASNTLFMDGNQSSASCSTGTSNVITNAGTVNISNTNLTEAGASGVSINNSGTLNVGPGNNFSSGVTNTGTISGQSANGVLQGACTGVVTSATTVGLYNLGENSATTCTVATVGLGQVMSKPGTVYALYCTATAGNQATDACTVTKNGAAQTMTCSLNGVATCSDGAVAHQVAYVAGDIVGIEAVGGTSTTLAAVKGVVVTQ